MITRTTTIGLTSLLFFLTSSLCSAAPITFNTALPISKNQFILREQLISEQLSGNNIERNTQSLVSTLVYGISAKFATFAELPLTRTELETPSFNQSESGIGDARLFGRYTAFSINSPGKTFRIAPFFGIEFPTGENSVNQPLNLGSGSYDFFAGTVATYATTNWTIDTQFSYQKNGTSNGLNIGDNVRIDGSFQYRLIPHKLTIDTTHFINGVVELNIINQQEDTLNGISSDNSSTQAFISPGLQYISQKWIVETNVQIPLNNNNSVLQTDYIARIGIRANF